VARRGGQTEGQTGPDGARQVGQTGWPDGGGQTGPDGVPDGGQTGWSDGVPDGARRGPDGELDKARQSARRAKRGGGRKDYLLLKEKMTCYVYVSCKSWSASDVSDTGWM
jgi:hypothetical protein